MSIRYLTKEDQERYKELSFYSFYDDSWDWDSPQWKKHFDNTPWEDCLGYEIDGVIESTWMTMNLPMFIRGELMDVAAVYGVTTSPEQRRKGYVRKMIVESLTHMRDNGQYVSALYPFKHSYYRKFGWETYNTISELRADPKNIRIQDGFKPLKIKEVSKEESYEYVREFRARIGSKYNLVMFKHQREWEFFKFWERSKLFAILDGEILVGYFIARLDREDHKQYLKAFEVLTETVDARYTWLDYVKKHTDQIKEFIWPLMGDEVVSEYFHELWGSGAKLKSMGGSMMRIIDARRVLESLKYPEDFKTSISFKVNDEYAPWNQTPFLLTISDGKAETSEHKGDVDIETDICALTQLITGFCDPLHLYEHKRLRVSPAKLGRLGQIFPKGLTRTLTGF